MKYLLLILIIGLPFVTLAQQPENITPYRYGIKVYNTTSPVTRYQNIVPQPGYAFAETQYLKPTFAAYTTGKNGNQHELELSDLSINKISNQALPLNGVEQTITNISVRYEYTILFIKKKRTHLKPSLGLSAMPFYTHYRLTPFSASYYPHRATYAGLQLAVIPRLNIYTNKRIFFDINVPLTFANMYYEHTIVGNPTLSRSLSENSVVNFDLAPVQYSIRLGAGLRI